MRLREGICIVFGALTAKKDAISKPQPLLAPVTMHTRPLRSTESNGSGPAFSI